MTVFLARVDGDGQVSGRKEQRGPKLAEDLAERQVSAVETSQQAAGLRGGCFSLRACWL